MKSVRRPRRYGKRVRRDPDVADQPDERKAVLWPYMTNGQHPKIDFMDKVHDLILAHPQGVNAKVFEKAIGIDLKEGRNEQFLNWLEHNELITIQRGGNNNIHITRCHPFNVFDKQSLRSLVLYDLPIGTAGLHDKTGRFGKCYGIKSSNLVDTYEGVVHDLNDMTLDGELVSMPCNGGNGELVYYPNKGGTKGSAFLKDWWRSIDIPSTQKQIVDYLVRVKLRDPKESHNRLVCEKNIREERRGEVQARQPRNASFSGKLLEVSLRQKLDEMEKKEKDQKAKKARQHARDMAMAKSLANSGVHE